MINTGDRVKIVKIIDADDATHLENMIGRIGIAISYIIYKNIKRHKIQFQDGLNYESYYFRQDEIEKVEGDE